jgi:hypothetical protein
MNPNQRPDAAMSPDQRPDPAPPASLPTPSPGSPRHPQPDDLVLYAMQLLAPEESLATSPPAPSPSTSNRPRQ